MRDFLRPFEQITKYNEGRKATINRVIPSLDFLLTKYEETLSLYPPESPMALALDAGWLKLRKYWCKDVDRATIYIAAIVLDPTLKWEYFELRWEAVWVQSAKDQLQAMWKTYNTSKTPNIPQDEADDTPEWFQWMRRPQASLPADEPEQYLIEPTLRVKDLDILA
ncbi:hypothetical protein N7G274_008966 [Stereocaulon virgatum]|uniref:HAT C-terminal dimerisation domain-containing protein n=1 Tax=Stereocaulon virgatum TaxID=373712 RepID=A0ABR3ZXD2_9LECA